MREVAGAHHGDMDDAPDTPIDPAATPEPDAEYQPTPEELKRRRLMMAAGVLAVVAAIVVVALLVTRGGDDDEDVATGSSTTLATSTTVVTSTTEATTTTETTAPTSTVAPTTTVAPPGALTPEQAAQVVWPEPATESRFSDPAAAATSFAVDLVGFTDPVVGEFQAGDSRSGEIEVRPRADGPVTLVFVRQVASDDSWWVIGAVTESIEVDEPAQGQAIDDPLILKGRARAFEGTVDVRVFADGNADPLGTGFVTGSGDGTLGAFEGEVRFATTGSGGWGVVVLSTASGEDGSVWEATAVRVGFIGGD